jgi:hypothetical protein
MDWNLYFICDLEKGTLHHNGKRPIETFASERGYKIFMTKCAGLRAGSVKVRKGRIKNKYRVVKISGDSFVTSRIIYEIANKVILKKQQIILHKNGNTLDDSISNLYIADKTIESFLQGVQSNNTSGSTGVRLHKPTGLWKAEIKLNGKTTSIGYFNNKEEAIKKRKEVKERLMSILVG